MGSAPVSGVGFGVSPKRILTNARCKIDSVSHRRLQRRRQNDVRQEILGNALVPSVGFCVSQK
jgi:hypothetical protein